jgi:uncharacterized protein YciI
VTYFVVTRERGGAWDPALPMRGQEKWDDHAAFMDALVVEGAIVLGGPLGPGERTFLLVFDAESETAIESRLAADPWTEMDLLRIAAIQPWELLLSGRP